MIQGAGGTAPAKPTTIPKGERNMSEKKLAERLEKLPEEQQRMVLATVRGMELANEANKAANEARPA